MSSLRQFEVRGAALVVREYRPDDLDGCVDCYNAIFPVDDPRVPPIDHATWRWKYDPSWSGLRTILVAEHPEIGIAGAYPSQPLRAHCEGREILVSHGTDLMVRHDWRRVGPRPGLFVTLGLAFNERFSSAGGPLNSFHYGWPVPAWRMGQRYLGYENARDWNFVAREIPIERRALLQAPDGVAVQEVEAAPADTDALFASVREGYRLSLVKDRGWFDWRYVAHPARNYRLFECRDGQRLRGLAVYTVADFRRPHTSFVVELLVDPTDGDALRALVAACEAQAYADETGALASVFSPVDPRFTALQRIGYDVLDSGYFMVVAAFGIDVRFVRENFFFTMGDSDLI